MSVCYQCIMCKHYRLPQTCEAFPDGIPKEIFTCEHDHREPYPGDNGIRFERKEPKHDLDRQIQK